MPITSAAKKALRQTMRHRARNVAMKERIRSLIKKTRKSAALGKVDDAKKLLREAMQVLDRAAQKKILKKNTAARFKSRLAKRVNSIGK